MAAVALALLALAAGGHPAAASAAAPPNFVGLQGWNQPSPDKFKRIGRAKVNTWRQNLLWSGVEKTRGRYTWRRYDDLFTKAAVGNVRIFPVLIGSPAWARFKPQYPPNTTAGRKAFYEFSKAAAKRYGPNGTFWRGKPYPRSVRPVYWQVWNEPNLPNYWNGKVDPPAYGRMLKYTSVAAKAGDPEVRIVSAGLPQTSCRAGPCIDDFLRDMYTVPDIGRWIDAVAVHTYADDYHGIFYRLRLARNQTISSLGRSKKLVVTEFGWGTGGHHPSFTTTERGQASRLRGAYREMIENRRRFRLIGAYWFGFRDPPTGDSWQYHTGLFGPDWRMKPAWRSLVSITGGQL